VCLDDWRAGGLVTTHSRRTRTRTTPAQLQRQEEKTEKAE